MLPICCQELVVVASCMRLHKARPTHKTTLLRVRPEYTHTVSSNETKQNPRYPILPSRLLASRQGSSAANGREVTIPARSRSRVGSSLVSLEAKKPYSRVGIVLYLVFYYKIQKTKRISRNEDIVCAQPDRRDAPPRASQARNQPPPRSAAVERRSPPAASSAHQPLAVTRRLG